jgi:hypothetical protein
VKPEHQAENKKMLQLRLIAKDIKAVHFRTSIKELWFCGLSHGD